MQMLSMVFHWGWIIFRSLGNRQGIDWTNLNYTPAYQTLVEWYIANLTTNLSTITTPWNTSALDSAYYFVIDEPGPSEYNLITNISTFIHAVCPQLRIMETMDQDLALTPIRFWIR